MSEQMLRENFDKVKNAIQKEKSEEIIDAITAVRNSIGQDMNILYEFVGDIFRQDPDFFNQKILKRYDKTIGHLLNIDQIFDLESYILKKHCFYRDEQLIAMTDGIAILGNRKQFGRIYLTNIRIICIGRSMVNGPAGAGLLDYLLLKKRNKSIVNGLQRRIGEAIGEIIPCIGTQYPMFGLIKKKVKAKKITYKVAISSDKGTKKYYIVIIPNRDNRSEFIQILDETIEATNAFYSIS